MATPYTAWIRGSNTFFRDDANSEVTTGASDSAPGTIGEPTTGNGWMELGAYSFDPSDMTEGEILVTPAGKRFDKGLYYQQWTIELERFPWPADATRYNALRAHLRKDHIYLAITSYDGVAQHNTGKVLAVTRETEFVHDHPNGTKTIKITVTARTPTT
jgi:hypothetical protein